jgi:hypothetical protein
MNLAILAMATALEATRGNPPAARPALAGLPLSLHLHAREGVLAVDGVPDLRD